MVFYRKYRPQTIEELDLGTVRKKLTSILESAEIPHAFLFSGPKGLGKTSSARILAKAINCEQRSKNLSANWRSKDQISKKQIKNKQSFSSNQKEKEKTIQQLSNEAIEPCNECSACISITNGSNIDVLEIDAASNRGIDEIRALREGIKFSPVGLPYKVYIIDEVHMLTTEAFNALLKTLEEPPSHALFILCTTEPWKLPATVISRALHVLFEKPSFDELERSLQRVVAGEKLQVAHGVIENIFDLSDGAFRDAHKLLEELAFLSNGEVITLDLLERTFKTKSIDHEVLKLLRALAQKDAREGLLVVDRLSQSGCDFRMVTEKVVEVLRGILFEKSGVSAGVIEKHLEGVNFTIESLETLLAYFNQAYKDIRFSVLPQLPLELAIMQWCVVDKVQSFDSSSTSLTASVQDKSSKFNPSTPVRLRSPQAFRTRVQSSEGEKEEKTSIRSDLKEKNRDVKRSDLVKEPVKKQFTDDDFIKQLITLVKKENHSIAGILRGCKLVSIQDGEVKLETSYKFHRDKLSDPKVQKIIETSASDILGKEMKISIKMK